MVALLGFGLDLVPFFYLPFLCGNENVYLVVLYVGNISLSFLFL